MDDVILHQVMGLSNASTGASTFGLPALQVLVFPSSHSSSIFPGSSQHGPPVGNVRSPDKLEQPEKALLGISVIFLFVLERKNKRIVYCRSSGVNPRF